MVDHPFTEAFLAGATVMREYLSRFVQQGGDSVTAQSMRLNWNPNWGKDPGFEQVLYDEMMNWKVLNPKENEHEAN
jgi:hypothetical protein